MVQKSATFVKDCNLRLSHGFEWISSDGICGWSYKFPLVEVCDLFYHFTNFTMIQHFKQVNEELRIILFTEGHCSEKGSW